MKTYGANDWTEVASLSRSDSKRRAKACRGRARQAARAQVDEELSFYYADRVRENESEARDAA
jgi:hypothetical protein